MVCSLTLCLGGVALFNCALDTDGGNATPGGQGTGGVGGEGGSGQGSGGAAGDGASAGTGGASGAGGENGNAGSGAGGGGNGDAGTAGQSGAGGSGGTGGPPLPDLLKCKPWVPDSKGWSFKGDAKHDAETKRIVLTPRVEGRATWGQAYLPAFGDAQLTNTLEVAFTFAFEPSSSGDGYDEGAVAWFVPESTPTIPPVGNEAASLGVPASQAGVALARDDKSPTPPTSFWAIYGGGTGGATLAADVLNESTAANLFSESGPPSPEGRYTASLFLSRDISGGGADDLDIRARLSASSDPLELGAELPDGADVVVFNGGTLGFSAGSTEGGAVHSLLGIEIRIDGECYEPLPFALTAGGRRQPYAHKGRRLSHKSAPGGRAVRQTR